MPAPCSGLQNSAKGLSPTQKNRKKKGGGLCGKEKKGGQKMKKGGERDEEGRERKGEVQRGLWFPIFRRVLSGSVIRLRATLERRDVLTFKRSRK